MKAFSFICKKINLSIFEDIVTVYKNKKNCLSSIPDAVDMFFYENDKELQLKDYIFTNHDKHSLCHNDEFSNKYEHYHIQFDKTIDKSKLEAIATVFVKFELLSDTEGKNLLSEFDKANEMNHSNKKIAESLDLGIIQKNKQNEIKTKETQTNNIFEFLKN